MTSLIPVCKDVRGIIAEYLMPSKDIVMKDRKEMHEELGRYSYSLGYHLSSLIIGNYSSTPNSNIREVLHRIKYKRKRKLLDKHFIIGAFGIIPRNHSSYQELPDQKKKDVFEQLF